jgi:hypothetical protein
MEITARSREALAWAAGFWDGEGCVSSLNTTGATNYPVFHIVQAGEEARAILQRVLDALQIPGSVTGPYTDKANPDRKPKYSMRISGLERVQAAAAMCWPWLSGTKKAQIKKALAAYHAVRPVNPVRTHCPRCGGEWVEPNIAYNPVNKSWRCRRCRRKNPDSARLNAQWRRVHVGADDEAFKRQTRSKNGPGYRPRAKPVRE